VKRNDDVRGETGVFVGEMLALVMLIIPVLICGTLGAAVGYFYRYRLQQRRLLTVVTAIVVFVLFEITSGTLSSKYTLRENLEAQFDLILPFIFLYLLPAAFGSFFVARRWRTWW
jgi:low affinity Fe/Cu permease